MPSLKDVKMKIVGVGKTKQITKAMNMVASAKLRGAQSRIERFRPYASKYHDVLAELSRKVEGSAHPLLTEHEEKKSCAIIMVTSDRGLCGSFNGNIISAAMKLAKEKAGAGMQVSFACVGRKGRDAVRASTYETISAYADRMGSIDFALASTVAQEVINGYEAMTYDGWFMVSSFPWDTSRRARSVCCPWLPPKLPQARKLRNRQKPVRPGASICTSLMKKSCWQNSCPVMSRCRSIAVCWTHRPANMPRVWLPWTMQRATATR